jgi:hypothetical protein
MDGWKYSPTETLINLGCYKKNWCGGMLKRGELKLKVARVLYESLEDGRDYEWSKLMELLVSNGINENYARLLLWDFYLLGLLERPKVGLYKINKPRLKAYMEEYEAKLARSKAGARGGRSGPQG